MSYSDIFRQEEETTVTKNEAELIKLIRENDNPERALMTATLIVLGYLKQHGSFAEQAVACPQVFC